MSGAYFEFAMFGAREIDQALQALQDIGTQKRILVGAMKKSLEPVAERARQLVPVDEGDLRDSIIVSTKITKRQAREIVGARGAPRVFAGTNWPSGHLVEFGTGPRSVEATKKKVLAVDGRIIGKTADVGHMPAQPFLRPAFEQMREKMLEIFGREMWKSLKRTAKRFEKQSRTGKLSKSAKRALGAG